MDCDYSECSQVFMESATARTMIDGDESPILIMHGLEDESVSVTNSIRFESALSEAGSDYSAHYLERVGHGHDPAWDTPEEYGKVHTFLEELLER